MNEEDVSISVRAFAREVGKSHVWILKMLKAGRLPRNEDGTLPLKKALEVYNTLQDEAKEKGKSTTPDIPNRDPSDAVSINAAMSKAKLAEKTYQARLRELEYKLKSGELLEKVKVAEEAQQLAGRIKNKLLAIPPRISVMCEGRIARDIEEIVTDAINDALRELQEAQK